MTSKLTTPLFFDSPQDFRSWLELHAATATELLVGFHKVATDKACMSWSESVDEALCFGWIDGKRKRIDEHSYSIRFTARKKSSIWSQINIDKMENLRSQGRMTAAGELAFSYRTEYKSAIYAHEQPTVASLSAEELTIFQSNAAAWSFFATTAPGYQKVLLHWICSAKKAETRLSRLAKLIEASAAGKKMQ
ncbi:YdeI/OmpD-associated family protein [Rheinheimera soli]|uniref:YdeI/OmpD-associated family protein n=1 Tax=Rheinheimera soli TaxID=443616 RepID=UPI001E33114B|nr:YdeI/OmpD-associated family protein [Rheinheimera soli]